METETYIHFREVERHFTWGKRTLDNFGNYILLPSKLSFQLTS